MLLDLFLAEDGTSFRIQANSQQSCHHVSTFLPQLCWILWKSYSVQADYGEVDRIMLAGFILQLDPVFQSTQVIS